MENSPNTTTNETHESKTTVFKNITLYNYIFSIHTGSSSDIHMNRNIQLYNVKLFYIQLCLTDAFHLHFAWTLHRSERIRIHLMEQNMTSSTSNTSELNNHKQGSSALSVLKKCVFLLRFNCWRPAYVTMYCTNMYINRQDAQNSCD